jgi:hypothetical protein
LQSTDEKPNKEPFLLTERAEPSFIFLLVEYISVELEAKSKSLDGLPSKKPSKLSLRKDLKVDKSDI